MPPPTPADAKVNAALAACLTTVDRISGQDVSAALDLVKQVKELEVHVSNSSYSSLRPLCTLAGKMTDSLIQLDAARREETTSWVRSLLEHLGQSTGTDVKRDAPARLHSTNMLTASGIRSRLALVDGQRLGEILVRMSYLRASDVERALELQRTRNCMLGEALVELELLSKEELEAALRVQRQRRNRAVDPWMTSWGVDGDERRPTGTP
jgi:hypothetical protein